MIETQRARRGHPFLPAPVDLADMPRLYETEGTEPENKIIVVHYFCLTADWWLAEIDPDHPDGPLGFGYCRYAAHPEGAEWGYVSLAELEQISATVRGTVNDCPVELPVLVERDLHWQPMMWKEVERLP